MADRYTDQYIKGLIDAEHEYYAKQLQVQSQPTVQTTERDAENKKLSDYTARISSIKAMPDYAEKRFAVRRDDDPTYWGVNASTYYKKFYGKDFNPQSGYKEFTDGYFDWYKKTNNLSDTDAAIKETDIRNKAVDAAMFAQSDAEKYLAGDGGATHDRSDYKGVYNYIYATEGKKAADQFIADTMERASIIQKQKSEDEYAASSGINRFASNAASIVTAPVGGVIDAVSELRDIGIGDNRIKPSSGLTVFSTATQKGTAQDIANAMQDAGANDFFTNLAVNTYSGVLSGLQSAVGASLLGRWYTPIMGLTAVAQRARELKEQGATAEQIKNGSLLSGVAEALFEYVSIDKLAKNFLESPVTGIKDFAKKALVQSGIEASEEMATELANQAIDAINRSEDGDYEQSIKAYMDDGYSRTDAEKKARLDGVFDILWAGYGGAVAGAGSAVAGVRNLVAYHNEVANIGKSYLAENSADDLIQAGLDQARTTTAYKTAKKMADGNMSNYNAGQLLMTIESPDTKKATAIQNLFEMTALNAGVSMEIAERVADIASSSGIATIVLQPSEDNGLAIKDGTGRVTSFANGYYDRQSNVVVLSSTLSAEQMEQTIIGHEYTHAIEDTEEYAKLNKIVQSSMGDEYETAVTNVMLNRQNLGEPISRDIAEKEVVANFVGKNVFNEKFVNRLVSDPNMAKHLNSLFGRIKGFVSNNKYAAAERIVSKALEVNNASQEEPSMLDIFRAAGGAYNTDGGRLFNINAMIADEEQYKQMLRDSGYDEEEIIGLFNTIDKAIELIQNNLSILDYAWDKDIDDRAFSPVKENSDPLYKISLDWSTMCRKRILQQIVQKRLQEALNRSITLEESIEIRNRLQQLQEEGKQIEVACALCYVEAARMKSFNQIKRFLNNRESIIKRYIAAQSGNDIKQAVNDAEMAMREQLGVDPKATLKSLDKETRTLIQEAKREPLRSYQTNDAEQREIEYAKTLTANDFTTADGLERLAKEHPLIFKAYVGNIRSATRSKGVENDTWWRAGDLDGFEGKIDTSNNENGTRTQSWSDFQVIHLMDYIASTIELYTKNAKLHAYTKVPDYVRLMGNTGVMINLSLIPMRDYDGTVSFDPKEGMDFAVSLELRDKYANTVGTIAIGINDEQIKKLLADDRIDYVIPYHSSGMNKVVRGLMHIPGWDSYQSFQTERKVYGENAISNAQKYGATLISETDEKWHKAPKFSEWFDYEQAVQDRADAMENTDGVTAGIIAMRKAAERYCRLCAERGLLPKFSYKKGFDMTQEDNYWKVLIDRKMVNHITGEIIEQQSVKPIFEEDDVLGILNDELERYPSVKADQDYAVEKVTNDMLREKISPTEAFNVLQKPLDNVTVVSILESSKYDNLQRSDFDESNPDIRYSLPVDNFNAERYNEIVVPYQEKSDILSEAMTWHADKIGKPFFVRKFGYVYTCIFDEDHELYVIGKEDAVNIHDVKERNGNDGFANNFDQGSVLSRNERRGGLRSNIVLENRGTTAGNEGVFDRTVSGTQRGDRGRYYESSSNAYSDIEADLKESAFSMPKNEYSAPGDEAYQNHNIPAVETERRFVTNRTSGNDNNTALLESIRDYFEENAEVVGKKQSDQSALDEATRLIANTQWQKELRKNIRDRQHKFSKVEYAGALVLLNNARNAGDVEETVNLITQISRHATDTARALQALSMFSKMTPEGMLKQATNIERESTDYAHGKGSFSQLEEAGSQIADVIENAVQSTDSTENTVNGTDADGKYTKEDILKLFQSLHDVGNLKGAILRNVEKADDRTLESFIKKVKDSDFDPDTTRREIAKMLGWSVFTDEDLQQILEFGRQFESLEPGSEKWNELYEDYAVFIARRIPNTVLDNLRAWRKLSMLFNIKTHVRNISSNAVYGGIRTADKATETMLERLAVRLGAMDESDRIAMLGWSRTELGIKIKNIVKEEADRATKENLLGSKYEDGKATIQQKRDTLRIDKGGQVDTSKGKSVISKVSDANSIALEKEDGWFYAPAYADALGQWMVLHNTTEVTDDARVFADAQAKEATFRSKNAIADTINGIKRNSKWGGEIVDVIIPFTNTPANIATQAVWHSPIGLAVGTYQLVKSARGKNGKGVSKAINTISKGVTGTALWVIGLILGYAGLFNTKYGKTEKERKADEAAGIQENAFVFGNVSFSFDWLQPSAAPLIMGASVAQRLKEDGFGINLFGALLDGTESLFELSMLQSLYDVFGGYDKGIVGSAEAVAADIVSQSIPTLVGQLARSIDPVQRSTTEGGYTDAFGDEVGKFVGQIAAKIPGLTYFLSPKLDVFGEEEYRTGLNSFGSFVLNIFGQVALPSNIKIATRSDPVSKALLNLYFSDEQKRSYAIPSPIKREDTDAAGFDFESASNVIGEERLKEVTAFMQNRVRYNVQETVDGRTRTVSKYYKDMTNDERLRVINRIYSNVKDDAFDEKSALYKKIARGIVK